MTKCLVVYVSSGITGTAECVFRHFPPTLEDIMDIQERISKDLDGATCAIINWLELSDD